VRSQSDPALAFNQRAMLSASTPVLPDSAAAEAAMSSITRSNRFLQELLARCRGVQRLMPAGELSTQQLSTLLRRCTEAIEIDLTHCRNVSGEVLLTLAACCSRVEVLYLSGDKVVSEATLAQLLQKLTSLRALKLQFCGSINGDSFRFLRTSLNNSSSSSSSSSSSNGNSRNNDNLRNNKSNKNKSTKIPPPPPPPRRHLQSLSLDHCYRVTDETLLSLSYILDGLTHLDLRCCAITAAGLEPLLQRSGPTLTELNVAGCKRIDDSLFQLLRLYCPVLAELNISGCKIKRAAREAFEVESATTVRIQPPLTTSSGVPVRHAMETSTATTTQHDGKQMKVTQGYLYIE
jgi:hypothetical protein